VSTQKRCQSSVYIHYPKGWICYKSDTSQKSCSDNILRIRRSKHRTSPGPLFQNSTYKLQVNQWTIFTEKSFYRRQHHQHTQREESRSNIRFPFQLRPNIIHFVNLRQHGTCVSFPQTFSIENVVFLFATSIVAYSLSLAS
jgi:hypothetical protein